MNGQPIRFRISTLFTILWIVALFAAATRWAQLSSDFSGLYFCSPIAAGLVAATIRAIRFRSVRYTILVSAIASAAWGLAVGAALALDRHLIDSVDPRGYFLNLESWFLLFLPLQVVCSGYIGLVFGALACK